MTALRWLAVVPVAVLAWYGAFAAGLALRSGLAALCPAEDMISGLCFAWWYQVAHWVAVKLSVAASAFVVVVSAAATAPRYRLPVAWTAYLTGAAVAAYFVTQTAAAAEFMVALGAGLGGVLVVAKRLKAPGQA